MNDKNTLYGAVYGAGFMGKTHFDAYRQISQVEIKGVIDPDLSRAREISGAVSCYPDIKSAVQAQKLDFVDICIPTPFHLEAVEEAFRNGLHVLVEKPLTAKADELVSFRNLEKEHGKRIMVAHVCRFMPIFLYAKTCVDSGRLGRPLAYSGLRYSQLPDWSHKNWINNRKMSGGTLIDLSIHDVDIANWLFGSPKQVYATETVLQENGPSHVMESIIYENGSTVHIEASHLLPDGYGLETSYKMVFENGFIQAGMYGDTVQVREFSEGSWKDVDVSNLVAHENAYAEELDHFVRALGSGGPFRVSLSDAVLAVSTVSALRDSIEERKQKRM
jgi:predicted dehydrogenase